MTDMLIHPPRGIGVALRDESGSPFDPPQPWAGSSALSENLPQIKLPCADRDSRSTVEEELEIFIPPPPSLTHRVSIRLRRIAPPPPKIILDSSSSLQADDP